MKAKKLMLHCLAEKKGDYWQAICLDLTLATQGDSFEEVRGKLDSVIESYLYDALAGDDKEYAEQLLTRRAPTADWIRYYMFVILKRLGLLKNALHRLFVEPIPMMPVSYCKH